MFTDKGTYKYNFKLRIRLDSPDFGTDNGGAGVDLKGYSIWLEIKKSDGSTYRIYLMLDDTYDHYYISNTEPVDVYFDESKSDSKIFYQSFSECYNSDGNWIGDGKNPENEVKKKVGWKLYLDTAVGSTPNLTPQMTSDALHLTSKDGSQYFKKA